jgi:TIR domain
LGHTAIYDAVELKPGSSWRDVLMQALSGADAVVVLITDEALRSPFVMGEIGATRALQHAYGRILLLPVLVGDVPEPLVINDVNWVRMEPTPSGIVDAASKLIEAFRNEQERLRGGYPKIFISHRHADEKIVKALVNVLSAAFEIKPNHMRCTSVHPYRLKVGERTSDRLRTELQRAEAVIGVISPDVKDSSYVLFELGASWGRAGVTFPLLIRGATIADVPAPIGDLHTLSLLDLGECYQLVEDLADVVSLPRQKGQDSAIAERIADLTNLAKG